MNNSLQAVSSGQGKDVILLHGLFGQGSNLRGIARALEPHFRVHCLDLPDHGRSPWLSSASLEAYSDEVLKWMNGRQICKSHMIGHSLGGKVAMQLALSDAERLKREHKDALHLAKLNAKKAARQDMDSQVFEAKKTLKSEHELEVMDLKQRLQNQNAAIDELKRKKEQGSMQAKGEVQEVLIEQKLRDLFPADRIEEVKKGANGADCIQHVQDGMILNAVKIYYESKRTKAFSPAWITKFKEDIHRLGADAGVLVTSVMPKGITKPSLVDGVWVCQLQDLPLLSQLLRKHVLLYSSARLAQESKGTKMELLYDYLTSELFANNIMRVLDRFDQLRSQLDKERRSLEKSWSKREKLITQAYNSLLDVNTSIQTIGGSDMDLLDRGFDALEKGEE